MATGHYDPRVAVKLGTTSDPTYDNMDVINSIKRNKYYGGAFSSTTGPIGTAPSFYGRNATGSTTLDGSGRWLYRDDAPYILMTSAELKFCLAEAYWKLGMKTEAFEAFKSGVKARPGVLGKLYQTGHKGSHGRRR